MQFITDSHKDISYKTILSVSVLPNIWKIIRVIWPSLSTQTGLIMNRPGETLGTVGICHMLHTFSNFNQWTDHAHNIALSHLDLKKFHRAWSIMDSLQSLNSTQLTLRFYMLPKTNKLRWLNPGMPECEKIGGASNGKLVDIICSPTVLIEGEQKKSAQPFFRLEAIS